MTAREQLIKDLRDRAAYERRSGDYDKTFLESHYYTAELLERAANMLEESKE